MPYDPQSPVACDVFVLMGQSNCVGTQATPAIDLNNDCAAQGTPDSPSGRIFQMRQAVNNNAIIVADEPLEHGGTITANRSMASSIGFSVAFARWYRSNMLEAGRSILLVPCASGGTGFSDNRWNPGNDLYEAAVSRTNEAMAKHSANRLFAMLWHQGEQDVSGGLTAAQYTSAFSAMVADYRSRVTGGDKCRVILGQLAPGPYSSTDVQAAITAMPSHVVGCDIASSFELAGDTPSDIHFTAASQRLFGPRYGAALQGISPYPTARLKWA